jgi:hypothetical protein
MHRRVKLATAVAVLLSGGFGCPAAAAFFDVVGGGLTAGPPYPSTPPVVVRVSDNHVPPRVDYIEDVAFTFSDGMEDVPMSAIVSDSGGGEGSPGPVLAMQYQPILEVSGQDLPAEIRIDSFFDIFAPVGSMAVAIPGPVTCADSFFDVFFDVKFSDGGIMSHHLHGQIPVGQDATFTNVSSELQTDMVQCRQVHSIRPGPNAAMGLPLMTVELTGSYVPEPATAALLALGGLLCTRRASQF